METFGNDLVAFSGKKVAIKFHCEKCDYKCFKKYNWNKHLSTTKHLMETNLWQSGKKVANKYYCENCDKNYNTNAGLWKHKKGCSLQKDIQIIDTQGDIKLLTKLVIDVVKHNQELTLQNNDLTHKIVDICKIGQTNNISNSFNSNNKTFNIQLFLNETCKDAMNIMDFIDSIKLQLSDLESVGKLGYVEGISNIIISNLNALDVTQRPVHCADKKREVMYVKDENKWEKEDKQKNKIKKAIHRVVCKSQRLIPEFKEKHPDCLKSSSKFSDQYNKIIVESMGGSGDNDFEKEEKIIRNISKKVFIEKMK
jgi:hypothetical protein